MKYPSKQVPRSNRGSVLLLVLIVIALLTLASMSLFDRMFAEHRGAAMHGRQLQARGFAESGVELARLLIVQDLETLRQAGGLYHNPGKLRGVLMSDSDAAALRGRFTLIAPALNSDGHFEGVRFGLENESARLNLNTVLLADKHQENGARMLLLALPGMTESIADAILDWLDEDDEVRPLGAERDHYTSLTTPYEPHNGPLETVEQLLLVRGVTPALLFGADANRNHLIDPQEEQLEQLIGYDDTVGARKGGWANYLTIYSAESNRRADGTAKIDVNMDDLTELHTQLRDVMTEEQAKFIVAYRQGGSYDGEEQGRSAGTVSIDFDEQGRERLGGVLDLVGVKTRIVPPEGEGEPVVVDTPFPNEPMAMRDFLPVLLENITANTDETIPGRLNINQAPRALLRGLPGLTPMAVDQIVANRDLEVQPERADRAYATWLVVDGILTLDEMKKLWPLVTAGGDVYRGQFVGYFEAEGPAARIEVVLDASGEMPKVKHWRDLREQGPGYPPDTLGIELTPSG